MNAHDTDSLVEIEIPSEFVELCHGWAGDTDCMLRAVSSTGGFTLGSRRPWSEDVNRYLSDREWHLSLWEWLESHVYRVRVMADRSNHEDAFALWQFECFAEDTASQLRSAYGLQESDVV